MSKLFEAFKAISSMGLDESAMNEKAFEVDKEGIEEMEKFVDVDENGTDDGDFSMRKFDDVDEVEVFDDHAPMEEKKPEDHTGQAILECSICHSNIFRDKDKVEINEDGTLADEGKECPYCGNPDGFYVVGMVEPFEEVKEETKEETKEDGKEEIEVEDKEEEKVEESLTESKDCVECEDGSCKDEFCKDEACEEKPADEKKRGAVVEAVKSRHLCKDNLTEAGLTKAQRYNRNADRLFDYKEKTDRAMMDFLRQNTDMTEEEINKAYWGNKLSDIISDRGFHDEFFNNFFKESVKDSKLTEAPIYGLEPQYDSRKSFYGKAQVDADGDRQTLYSYNTKVAEIKDGKVKLFPEWNFSATTLRHIKDFLRQNGFRADSSKQISADYEVVEESLKEDTQAANVVDKYQEWVDYDMKKYGKISDITKRKLDKAGFEVVKDDHGDYEVIAKDKKELGESFEKVEVETDTDKVTVETEGDKVKVETEPKEKAEEVVAEVTAEDADEMVDGETEEDSEEEFSEIDTETLDQANESYLRENYSNVRSYKTKDIYKKDGKIFVEGVITFKSGNKKKTSFIFESVKGRHGKARFIGENKEIARGNKAFRLSGSVKDKKFMTESLGYRYTVKDVSGKNALIWGTAHPTKRGK